MNFKRRRPKNARRGCLCGSKYAKIFAPGPTRGKRDPRGGGSGHRAQIVMRVRAQETE